MALLKPSIELSSLDIERVSGTRRIDFVVGQMFSYLLKVIVVSFRNQRSSISRENTQAKRI